MTTITLSGTGILGGVVLDDSPEAEERCEENRAQEARWAAEAEAAELDQQKLRDQIDAICAPHLKEELEAVNKTARVSEKDKELFKKFQATCERWGFQSLPSCAQAVAVHLAQESVHGAAHIARIARSISLIHTATQMSVDPCSDVLVKALLLQARNEEKATPTKG